MFFSQACQAESGDYLDDSDLEQQEFVTKLFKHYPLLMAYATDYPAIIDPNNKNQFFALTIEKANYWAQHRVSALVCDRSVSHG